jgi:hypothetical protein
MAGVQLVDCVCASCGGTTRWPATQAQQPWFCPKCGHENAAAKAPRLRRPPQETEPAKGEAHAATGKMRSSGECRPLLDAATKSLFRENAFRVTGLRVDATAREVTRHVAKLKLMEELGQGQNAHTGVFALTPPPSLDEIRDALQKLKDPEQRLIDEFFWFWPEEFSQEEPDEGIRAVQRGAADQAVAFWSPREDGPTNGVVAKHNLAVLYHLCAVEWESHAIHTEPDESRRRQTEQYWKGSLTRWEGLLADDHFWEKLASRIRQTDDPRLNTGFGRRMRASLPDAVNRINVEIALAYAAAGKLEDGRRHVRFIRETHRGWTTLEKAARTALAPATARLNQQIKQAREDAATNPAKADEAANALISQAQPLLDIFDLFFGEQEHSEKELLDEAATACVGCSVAYQRQTGDNETFLALLERALPLADSVEVRRRIEDNIGIAKRNLEAESLDAAYANLKTIQDSPANPKSKLRHLRAELVPLLESLKQKHGFSSQLVIKLSDSIAIVLRGISIEAHNKYQDFTTALDAIHTAHAYAFDPDLKGRTAEDLETVRKSASNNQTANFTMHGRDSTPPRIRTRQSAAKKSPANATGLGCLAVIAIFVVLGAIGACDSPSTTSSTKPNYRVPSYMTADLATEREAIEAQRTTATQLENEADTLAREIESARAFLDRTSQFEVDQFNAKVNRYNAQAAAAKAQTTLLNQMIDSYNVKLQRAGR